MKNKIRKQLRFEAMRETLECCRNFPLLASAITQSNESQAIISADQNLPDATDSERMTNYSFTPHWTLPSARPSMLRTLIICATDPMIPGGDPFEGNRLEERICRCSTMLPSLRNASQQFHEQNVGRLKIGTFDFLGSDEMILTKGVRVFRDIQANEETVMLPKEQWYDVDILSCIAPIFQSGQYYPAFYKKLLRRRLKRALNIAAHNGYERIIMNAWGCEGERNDIGVVSMLMRELFDEFGFAEVVIECNQVNGDKLYDKFRPEKVVDERKPVVRKYDANIRHKLLLAGEPLSKLKLRSRNGCAIVSPNQHVAYGSDFEATLRESGLCHKKIYGCFRQSGEMKWKVAYFVVAEDRYGAPSELNFLTDKLSDVQICEPDKPIEEQLDEFVEKHHSTEGRFVGCFIDENPDGWISRMGRYYNNEIF